MIPTFNQAIYILDAIRSALAQTYPELEVIVGDDASSDRTADIVTAIADKRLKYIRNSVNLGRTANYRNLLINHATGEYVINLDGDDYFTDPDFVSEAVKCIEANENVIMVAARVTTKFRDTESVSPLPAETKITGQQLLSRLPFGGYSMMHMGVMYARKPAIKIDFYRSAAISSDWESLYRLALDGLVAYLNRNVGVWRIHGENESATTDMEKLLDNLDIWSAIYKEARKHGMNLLAANYHQARCVAFYSIQTAQKIMGRGGKVLTGFLFAIFRKNVLAGMIILLTPAYLAVFVRGIIGKQGLQQ